MLAIEQEELGIAAGLQDRVIQVYEGLVYMDFDRGRRHEVDGIPCYHYEPLDPALLPPVYLAYHDALSEPTEVFHNNIRERFNRGEEPVVAAMRHFASLAERGREAIRSRDAATLGRLIDENFDTRRGIYALPAGRSRWWRPPGGSAPPPSSPDPGGAIVGTYADEAMFARLQEAMGAIGSRVVRPQIAASS